MASTHKYGLIHFATMPIGHAVGSVAVLAVLWFGRSRQRRALKKLDDRLLRDVGIGRVEADNEARKWFWQA